MKFRIIERHNRYFAQIKDKDFYNGYQWEDVWNDIGYLDGYGTIEAAKQYCQEYKYKQEERVVEVFEL